ncbi:hypothetical protein POTOM_029859 [Populus tomentosa]|uniref:Uncharacterized protein n=1 Tax=Populus tomentosa TaxID=118781 RepID=A0A8X8CTK9_POPTO|nr:hypothetical protein POTOM_029859 [Populus tomentosa]
MRGKLRLVDHIWIAILMEFSQTLGCKEECSGTSGSESGWTSYIASPIKENNFDDDNDDSKNKQGDCREGNYESDDSMASDASSGPSHPELPCRINGGSINKGPFKNATTKYSSKEKLHRQVKRRDGARTTVKKEVSVLKANSAASHDHVQSGTQNSTVKLVSLPPSPFPRKVNFDSWKCKWCLQS